MVRGTRGGMCNSNGRYYMIRLQFASLIEGKGIQRGYRNFVSTFVVLECRARRGTGTGILF